MTYQIGRTYRIEAAHSLPLVPIGHKCRNVHGHTYRIDISLTSASKLNKGFVVDFAELDLVMDPILTFLDHKYLNDIMDNPTAELLAEHIRKALMATLIGRGAWTVRVWENPDMWAEAS